MIETLRGEMIRQFVWVHDLDPDGDLPFNVLLAGDVIGDGSIPPKEFFALEGAEDPQEGWYELFDDRTVEYIGEELPPDHDRVR